MAWSTGGPLVGLAIVGTSEKSALWPGPSAPNFWNALPEITTRSVKWIPELFVTRPAIFPPAAVAEASTRGAAAIRSVANPRSVNAVMPGIVIASLAVLTRRRPELGSSVPQHG